MVILTLNHLIFDIYSTVPKHYKYSVNVCCYYNLSYILHIFILKIIFKVRNKISPNILNFDKNQDSLNNSNRNHKNYATYAS